MKEGREERKKKRRNGERERGREGGREEGRKRWKERKKDIYCKIWSLIPTAFLCLSEVTYDLHIWEIAL
jgi:hypothetical protein